MDKNNRPFSCPKCHKNYKLKRWFDKHTIECLKVDNLDPSQAASKSAVPKKDSKPKNFKCQNCNKSFQGAKCLDNHVKYRCSSAHSNISPASELPKFDDLFGMEIESIFEDELPALRQFIGYLRELTEFERESDKLKILHLNINSLFSKLLDLNQILDTDNFDLIFLNETKLDSSTPHSFFVPENYKIIRRDRVTDGGGGVMVLYKKSIKLISHNCLDDLEVIHVKLNLNNIEPNFFCCYNPNFNLRVDFISRLEKYLYGIDLSTNVFIIGDLNIDMQSSVKAVELNTFTKVLGFRNIVDEPTRAVKRRSNKKSNSN